MNILKPYHSESRTLWYVNDGDKCVATLEIGQKYLTDVGNIFELIKVIDHTGYVQVRRIAKIVDGKKIKVSDDISTWRVESLINSHNVLIPD